MVNIEHFSLDKDSETSLDKLCRNIEATDTDCQSIIVNKILKLNIYDYIDKSLQDLIAEFRLGDISAIHLTNLPSISHPIILSVALAYLFGQPIRYEGEGDYVVEIKSQEGAGDQPSFRNAVFFPLHTDLSYVEQPPYFFLLHSVFNDTSQGGQTLLCDIYDVISMLSHSTFDCLKTSRFYFKPPPHYSGEVQGKYPILSELVPFSYAIRFREDMIQYSNDLEKGAIEEFLNVLHSHTVHLDLLTDTAMVINNHRCLHGRTAFTNQGQQSRHLNRVYIQ